MSNEECTHADGCGCGDNWNQMRREAYQHGKDIGRRQGAEEERERLAKGMLARDRAGMTPMSLPAVIPDYAQWIRTGGKP